MGLTTEQKRQQLIDTLHNDNSGLIVRFGKHGGGFILNSHGVTDIEPDGEDEDD